MVLLWVLVLCLLDGKACENETCQGGIEAGCSCIMNASILYV